MLRANLPRGQLVHLLALQPCVPDDVLMGLRAIAAGIQREEVYKQRVVDKEPVFCYQIWNSDTWFLIMIKFLLMAEGFSLLFPLEKQ